MASLDDLTKEVINAVDGALGCAVVDLSSGLLLSVSHNVPYFTQTYLEAVAAAAVDMFRGRNVQAVESLLSNQRGVAVENTIKEVQMTTEHTFHFMVTPPGKPDALVVLITSKKTNLGMGWASLRRQLPNIAPLVP
ncbi:MAG: hypothetical protein KAG26_02720 [Methylococcales bacterium]|nr:hypothetical protein [Methylococcales bacterium]